MLREIVISNDIVNFNEMWNLWQMRNSNDSSELLNLLGAKNGTNDIVLESMEIYLSPKVDAICCYDKKRVGRYFIEEHNSDSQLNLQYVFAGLNDKINKQPISIIEVQSKDTINSIKEVLSKLDGIIIFIGESSDDINLEIDKIGDKYPVINMTGNIGLISIVNLIRGSKFMFGDGCYSTIAKMIGVNTISAGMNG